MISLLIPCYNEEAVLRLTYERVSAAAQAWDESVELIFVDDGSTDGTWSIISSLAAGDARVRGYQLSRNFGHQAAVGAGLEHALGDAVVVLDADLQDPPELVGDMIQKWRAGFEVVYAQRNCRQGESIFKRVTGKLFYWLLDCINDVSIPRDTGDFALMDAVVVRWLVSSREHSVFWRGLRCWTGFRHTAVTFDRLPRAGGRSKYTLRKLIQLASSGLLSFSSLPLRFSLYLGGALMTGTLLAGCVSLVYALSVPGAGSPLTPILFAVLLLGAVQLMTLGVMGEFLNRIYDEVRDRPRWIVRGSVGEAQPEKLNVTHRRAG